MKDQMTNLFDRVRQSPRALLLLAGALALPFAGATTGVQAQTKTAASSATILGEVQAHLRAVDSMTANFTQTDRAGKSLPGKLLLKRPGKIRFEYGAGVPLLIVGDGGHLYLVDYAVNQVQRWPIGNSPLAVLLRKDIDVTKYGKVNQTSDPRVVSVAVRDPKQPEFGTITMIFLRDKTGPGGLRLNSWVALDAQNKRTTVKLTGTSYNVAIPDARFAWKDPRKKK